MSMSGKTGSRHSMKGRWVENPLDTATKELLGIASSLEKCIYGKNEEESEEQEGRGQ